jgi:hypothetical protein
MEIKYDIQKGIVLKKSPVENFSVNIIYFNGQHLLLFILDNMEEFQIHTYAV